jgi:beta-lactamase superfamily II metal-dependent hydrolase
MRIDIFNVGHGQCVALTASNGRRMMLDCGDRWGDDRFWTPSLHFFRETIDLLALMNLDEDHLRGFKNVMQDCTVPVFAIGSASAFACGAGHQSAHKSSPTKVSYASLKPTATR